MDIKVTHEMALIGGLTKICSCCGEEKSVSEYYKDKGCLYGCVGKCKSCVIKRVTAHRKKNKKHFDDYGKKYYQDNIESRKKYLKANEEQIRKRRKAYSQKNKEHIKDYGYKWRIDNKERYNEYHRFYNRSHYIKKADRDDLIDTLMKVKLR